MFTLVNYQVAHLVYLFHLVHLFHTVHLVQVVHLVQLGELPGGAREKLETGRAEADSGNL